MKNLTYILLLIITLHTGNIRAKDWPQYRSDETRSGYTSESLPSGLSMMWHREARHKPNRAWVGRSWARSRMKFDWAYDVIIAEGTCFFGSSSDHKIYALDAKTGKEKWHYFTGGPIRLTPSYYNGNIYIGSDDGYLYCLRAKDGKLVWKLRGGPEEDLLIGNGSMISRWCIRGGPAIKDGTVYFGAGIWPTEGIYIYGVDASSGKVKWCNRDAGAAEIDYPHMGAYSRGGPPAQGYVAVTKDKVFISTGRSVPAAFNRKTGKFLYYHLSRMGGKTPKAYGASDICVNDKVFINDGCIYDTATGLKFHQIGKREWWDKAKFVCAGVDIGKRQAQVITPVGYIRSEGPGLFGSILDKKTYETKREAETALKTHRLKTVKQTSSKHHVELIEDAPYLKDTWSAKIDKEPQALIVAGDNIAFAASNKISLFNIKSKKITWSEKVDSTVYGLAAADKKLYVSTASGSIYCFQSKKSSKPIIIKPLPKKSPYPTSGKMNKAVEDILKKAGDKKGYCLDLDCGDGQLAYEIAKRSELKVIALSKDPKKVSDARIKLDRAGVYGTRVTVLQGDLKSIQLPDYFANLIVSSENISGGKAIQSDDNKRLQRPYNGALCTWVSGEIKSVIRKELKGSGKWPHPLGDAGNNFYSGDEIVKGPLGMLWFEDEWIDTIDRHGKNPPPLYYKGVLIREGIHGVKGVDAYNGTELWFVSIPGLLSAYLGGSGVGAVASGPTYCVVDGIVYVRDQDHCLLIDAYTGKIRNKFIAPKSNGKKGVWTMVIVENGVLYGALANEKHLVRSQHGNGDLSNQTDMTRQFTESSLLFGIDVKTGKLLWTRKPKYSIRNNSFAAGNGILYYIDRPIAELDTILKNIADQMRRQGKALPVHPKGILFAIDGKTGKEKWKETGDIWGTTLSLSKKHDVLIMMYNKVGRAMPSDGFNDKMQTFKASTGKRMWEKVKSGSRPVINDKILYSSPKAYNLLTGKTIQVERDGKKVDWGYLSKGSGCGPSSGSKYLLLRRAGCIGYYDLDYDPGFLEHVGSLRSGCWINSLPVGGIVLVPDDSRGCRCSYPNQASIALIERGVRAPEIFAKPGQNNFQLYHKTTLETLFKESLYIAMSHPDKKYEIRYTTDDSYPTVKSPVYKKPFKIDKTTTVRAAVFKDGKKLAIRDGYTFTKVKEFVTGKSRKKKFDKSKEADEKILNQLKKRLKDEQAKKYGKKSWDDLSATEIKAARKAINKILEKQ